MVLTEPQSSIGAEVSDAEEGKTTGDIILEKDPVESAVETGGSAAVSPEKSPAAEPSVVVDVDDEDTESDSYGEEVDHSSAATGLGKDP